MQETNRIEFKSQYTDELDIEKEVIAFLNYREGGIIYIGIDDDGKPVGVDDIDSVVLKIKDKIRKNVSPSPMGLFDVLVENIDGVDVIKIFLASGSEKPYYKTKYGMSTRGCYIRVGTAAEPMPTAMIEDLFAHRVRNSLRNIVSPRQDLTFSQLRIYYQEKGLHLNGNYLRTLELLTDDGRLNYVAYLLADENGMSIKLAKYSGTDRVDLTSNNEYGYCCLLTATNRLLDKLKIENQIHTTLTYKKRIDTPLWNPQAIHEAVINFIVHNDYSREVPPKIEIFSDRLEITSYGSLPEGLAEDEFFSGVSLPRNKELMRIFRDVDMVEALGSGMPRIMSVYNRENFTWTEHFMRLVVPFDESLVKQNESLIKENESLVKPLQNFNELEQKLSEKNGKKVAQKVVERRMKILETIIANPFVTMEKLAQMLDISIVAVNNNFNELKRMDFIRHSGPVRGGCWDIFNDDVKQFVKHYFKDKK
ncbi:MAG: putative DNA binding domain-containing protein [Bacteroidales bacterium]|nr:putative DNA binding domain-containing protein [Bacteroidales bacterium]